MKLKAMLEELIELGESQTSIVSGVSIEHQINQSSISKILNQDRDPRYQCGKAIENYYNRRIKPLRKAAELRDQS